MRVRHRSSALLFAPLFLAACAHRPDATPPSAMFACDRASDEAYQNAVEAMWGRSDAARLSPLAPGGGSSPNARGITTSGLRGSRSAWGEGYSVQGRYWTEQCRLALAREAMR